MWWLCSRGIQWWERRCLLLLWIYAVGVLVGACSGCMVDTYNYMNCCVVDACSCSIEDVCVGCIVDM